ncbi:MAG: tRNA preQ1(34) S-adenosylmethionine ribosyltransferase-isomerase QueA [Acidobacteria bacterium]|nr:tRNA preQ1(34) S-adenosylmethionine ribosyltransferase-isomerase QueA [Acidobacteriota bacterium]
MKTSDFYYDLPADAIAQSAIEPRHDSRLLDTRTMSDHRFLGLAGLLEAGDLVVVNRTRVRRARLTAKKPTGGTVEILLLRALDDGRWEALGRPTKRLGAGSELLIGDMHVGVVTDPVDGRIVIEAAGDLGALAERVGEVPLPPYFTGKLDDPDRYQTMFADRVGSAAAPTAGLHFTEEVTRRLTEREVGIDCIELEVGLDTFRPIIAEILDDHEMHSERVTVGDATVERIEATHRRGSRIVAIGTTVVRALESAAAGGTLRPMSGPSSLFVRPGYRFHVVDLVVTNFHVPSSTLVIMIAAMLGDRWREVYTTAIGRGYRFLSFGDAMLAEVPR